MPNAITPAFRINKPDEKTFALACGILGEKKDEEYYVSRLAELKEIIARFIEKNSDYEMWAGLSFCALEAVMLPLYDLRKEGELYDPAEYSQLPNYYGDLREFIYRYGKKKSNPAKVDAITPELFFKFLEPVYLKDLYYTAIAKSVNLDEAIRTDKTRKYLCNIGIPVSDVRFIKDVSNASRTIQRNAIAFIRDFVKELKK